MAQSITQIIDQLKQSLNKARLPDSALRQALSDVLDNHSKKDINETVTTSNGQTLSLLHVAAFVGNADIIKVLLSQGANIYVFNKDKEEQHIQPLDEPARDIIQQAIQDKTIKQSNKDSENINNSNHFFDKLLCKAVDKGHYELTQALLNLAEQDLSARRGGSFPISYKKTPSFKNTIKPLLEIAIRKKRPPEFISLFEQHYRQLDTIREKNDKSKAFIDFTRSNIQQHYLVHLAAEHGHSEALEYLLKNYDDKDHSLLNATNEDRLTPLQVAAKNGQTHIVTTLIDHYKQSVDQKTPENQNDLLALAVYSGSQKLVDELINRGFNVNGRNNLGQTALHIAAKEGHLELANHLINKHNANINAQDNNSDTPLSLAIKYDHIDLAKELINKKGYDQAKLYQACVLADRKVYSNLINAIESQCSDQPPTFKTKLNKNETPSLFDIIHELKQSVNDQVKNPNIDLLLQILDGHSKANVDEIVKTRDNRQLSLLHVAAIVGNADVIKVLINQYQAKINILNTSGNTPLHLASSQGRYEAVNILAHNPHANLEAMNQSGSTALRKAIEKRHSQITELLLSQGANIYVFNQNEKEQPTPLDQNAKSIIEQAIHDKTIKQSNKDSENINNSNHFFDKLLCKAVDKGHYELTQALLNLAEQDFSAQGGKDFTTSYKKTPSFENTIKPLLEIAIRKKHSPEFIHLFEQHCRQLDTIRENREKNNTNKAFIDFTSSNIKKHHLVHLAAEHGHLDALKHLIDNYNDNDHSLLNATNEDRLKPLQVAAKNGQTHIVTTLIDHYKQSVNQATQNDLLALAVYSGSQKLVDELIHNYGFKVNEEHNNLGQTALHIAAKEGHLELANHLIDNHRADINARDNKQATPLYLAINFRHTDLAKQLIHQHSTKINELSTQEGSRSFGLAAKRGHTDVISTIMQRFPKRHAFTDQKTIDQLLKLLPQPDKREQLTDLLWAACQHNHSLLAQQILVHAEKQPDLIVTTDQLLQAANSQGNNALAIARQATSSEQDSELVTIIREKMDQYNSTLEDDKTEIKESESTGGESESTGGESESTGKIPERQQTNESSELENIRRLLNLGSNLPDKIVAASVYSNSEEFKNGICCGLSEVVKLCFLTSSAKAPDSDPDEEKAIDILQAQLEILRKIPTEILKNLRQNGQFIDINKLDANQKQSVESATQQVKQSYEKINKKFPLEDRTVNQNLTDIYAIVDTILAYQKPTQFDTAFFKDDALITQPALPASDHFMPDKLYQDPPTRIADFLTIMENSNNLVKYLSILESEIGNGNHDFTLSLSNSKHRIQLNFNSKSKEWQLFEQSTLFIKAKLPKTPGEIDNHSKNLLDLINMLSNRLLYNPSKMFSTQVFVNNSAANDIANYYQTDPASLEHKLSEKIKKHDAIKIDPKELSKDYKHELLKLACTSKENESLVEAIIDDCDQDIKVEALQENLQSETTNIRSILLDKIKPEQLASEQITSIFFTAICYNPKALNQLLDNIGLTQLNSEQITSIFFTAICYNPKALNQLDNIGLTQLNNIQIKSIFYTAICYNPKALNQLLDNIGLTQLNSEEISASFRTAVRNNPYAFKQSLDHIDLTKLSKEPIKDMFLNTAYYNANAFDKLLDHINFETLDNVDRFYTVYGVITQGEETHIRACLNSLHNHGYDLNKPLSPSIDINSSHILTLAIYLIDNDTSLNESSKDTVERLQEAIKVLLEYNPPIDIILDSYHNTNNPDVKELLGNKVKDSKELLGNKVKDSEAELLKAIEGNQTDEIEKILQKKPLLEESYLKGLYKAIACGHKDSVSVILQTKDISHKRLGEHNDSSAINDFVDAEDHYSALHIAALYGQADIVKMLIDEYKASDLLKTASNDLQCTQPIHLAAQNGHTETVKILIQQYGVDPASLCQANLTPLHLAAENGYEQTVQSIIQAAQEKGYSSKDLINKQTVGYQDVIQYASRKSSKASKSLITYLNQQMDNSDQAEQQNRNAPESPYSDSSRGSSNRSQPGEHYGKRQQPSAKTAQNPPTNNKYQKGTLYKLLKVFKKNIPSRIEKNNKIPNQIELLYENVSKDKTSNITKAIDNKLQAIASNIDHNLPLEQIINTPCLSTNLTLLHLAVLFNNQLLAKQLIEMGANTNPKTLGFDNTPLHFAAKHGSHEMIETLLTHNANPNLANNDGFTPLHLAAFKEDDKHLDIIESLAKQSNNINAQTENGSTPLHLATLLDKAHTVEKLQKLGADLSVQDKRGSTALHLATRLQKSSTKNKLKELGADLSIKDNQGKTAAEQKPIQKDKYPALTEQQDKIKQDLDSFTDLHSAVMYEKYEKISSIIKKNPELVTSQTKNGYTPLHIAAIEGNIKATSLITRKINSPHKDNINEALEKTTTDGRTPLHLACLRGRKEIIIKLLQFNNNINQQDKDDNTPLDLASSGPGYNEIKNILKMKGGKTSEELRQTPLNESSGQFSKQANQKSNAQESETDPGFDSSGVSSNRSQRGEHYGRTSLHQAVLAEDTDLIKSLLAQNNNDLLTTDQDGQTPLHKGLTSIDIVQPLDIVQTFKDNLNEQDFRSALNKPIDISKLPVILDPEYTGQTPARLAIDGGQLHEWANNNQWDMVLNIIKNIEGTDDVNHHLNEAIPASP